jgi:A/G-specific adenine glycosylase
MDLGATVCTSQSQNCSKCPLNYDCKNAYKDFQFESKLRKDKPKKKIHFTLARTKKSFLLFKKNEKSFWESLWVPYNTDHHDKNILFKEPDKREVTTIKHLLSHLELEITIEIFNYKTPFKIKSNLEHKWIKKDQIHKYGLPKPIKTIIDNHVC